LASELDVLRDHLLPHQLAVGLPCGVDGGHAPLGASVEGAFSG
jgi:hypothetical protein